MQHAYHRVPVTALAFLGERLLLAGAGNSLQVYRLNSNAHIASIKVFDTQAIHGILAPADGHHVLVWGGRHLRLLTVDGQGGWGASLGDTYSAADWILHVALAPSADDSECTAGLITAHNAVWTIHYEDLADLLHEHRAPEGTLERAISGSNCILYSAHAKWLSASHCLIASGTAFGDVILWSSFFDEESAPRSQVHFTFPAHQGSVFGVRLSSLLRLPDVTEETRLLATCSDDRTIRLWDVTDLSAESPTLTQVQRDTGFGARRDTVTHAPSLLASVMGHASRIWHVRFLYDALPPEGVGPRILSCGEDASANTWQIHPAPASQEQPYELLPVQRRSFHNGKNIWAVAQNGTYVATGGADGQIAHYPTLSGYGSNSEIPRSLLSAVDRSGEDNYRTYAFLLNDNQLIATTEQGRVVLLHTGRAQEPTTELAPPLSGLRGYSVAASEHKTAFVSGSDGVIYCYTQEGHDGYTSTALLKFAQRSGKTAGLFVSRLDEDVVCLLATGIGSEPSTLYTLRKGGEWPPFEHDGLETSHLASPTGTAVTSFDSHKEEESAYAFIGSNSGSILIYRFQAKASTNHIEPIYVQDRVHGNKAITSIHIRKHRNQHHASDPTWALSTGRDGTLAIHRISFSPSAPPSLDLVHQLSLPFGPNVEGLSITEMGEWAFVWGFEGKHFVQYDTSAQREVLRVECGGAHRNWAFSPAGRGGTLVWTKAGRVFRSGQYVMSCNVIGMGGHGREIKAAAVSERLTRGNGRAMQILATGAEDTDIKLFGLRSSEGKGQSQCWQTLRKHNTGIQHLAWSGLYLFSSGGFEEFFVWRVEEKVPCFKVGVVCVASHPRSGRSDLRVCGFDVHRLEGSADGEGRATGFEIGMAYSDSTLRLWRYTIASGDWELRKAGDYLTSCLTHVFRRSGHGEGEIVTAATDGHLALWRSEDSEGGGGAPLTWHRRHRVHQSAIHALTSSALPDDSTLVATGGDDNAIALTRIASDGTSHTLSLPRAHAAAVTGVALLRTTPTRAYANDRGDSAAFWLVSAGIDQRVKLWMVTVDVARHGIEGVEVKRVQDVFTPVADVSSLEPCLLDAQGDQGVVVCGVGMDVWRLPQDTMEGGMERAVEEVG